MFHHELHQNTNIHNDDGNNNRKGRNGWGDRGDSFNYDITDASMKLWYKDERVSSGECSSSTVKKEHAKGVRGNQYKGCWCEPCRWREMDKNIN